MTEKFSRYDTADYLKTEEDMVFYQCAVLFAPIAFQRGCYRGRAFEVGKYSAS
jgi:hypothetical protein